MPIQITESLARKLGKADEEERRAMMCGDWVTCEFCGLLQPESEFQSRQPVCDECRAEHPDFQRA